VLAQRTTDHHDLAKPARSRGVGFRSRLDFHARCRRYWSYLPPQFENCCLLFSSSRRHISTPIGEASRLAAVKKARPDHIDAGRSALATRVAATHASSMFNDEHQDHFPAPSRASRERTGKRSGEHCSQSRSSMVASWC
jgi:hypothetical protein